MAPSVEVMNRAVDDSENNSNDPASPVDREDNSDSHHNEEDPINKSSGDSENSNNNSANQAGGIMKPGPHDVLLGRGGGTNNHSGNVKFRSLVNEHKMRYLACNKVDKPKVAREVVALWRKLEPAGRFLARKDDTKRGPGSVKAADNVWYEVGDKKAREKASQCLRERTPDVLPYIQQLRQQQDAFTEQGVSFVQQQLQMQQQQQQQQQKGAVGMDNVFMDGMGGGAEAGASGVFPCAVGSAAAGVTGGMNMANRRGSLPVSAMGGSTNLRDRPNSETSFLPRSSSVPSHAHMMGAGAADFGGPPPFMGAGGGVMDAGAFVDDDFLASGAASVDDLNELEFQHRMMMMQQQMHIQQLQMHRLQQERLRRMQQQHEREMMGAAGGGMSAMGMSDFDLMPSQPTSMRRQQLLMQQQLQRRQMAAAAAARNSRPVLAFDDEDEDEDQEAAGHHEQDCHDSNAIGNEFGQHLPTVSSPDDNKLQNKQQQETASAVNETGLEGVVDLQQQQEQEKPEQKQDVVAMDGHSHEKDTKGVENSTINPSKATAGGPSGNKKRQAPERTETQTSLMSLTTNSPSNFEDGEITLEEYRRQLEDYIASTINSCSDNKKNGSDHHHPSPHAAPRRRVRADQQQQEHQDNFDSDLEDDWEKEKEKNYRRQHHGVAGSATGASGVAAGGGRRGVNRNVSGASFMSAKTNKSNAALSVTNMSLFSDLMSFDEANREQKMSCSRSVSSNLSLMSELTDLSQNIDELSLYDD